MLKICKNMQNIQNMHSCFKNAALCTDRDSSILAVRLRRQCEYGLYMLVRSCKAQNQPLKLNPAALAAFGGSQKSIPVERLLRNRYNFLQL